MVSIYNNLIVVDRNSLTYLYFNYKQYTIAPIFFYIFIYLSIYLSISLNITFITQIIIFNTVLSLLLLDYLLNPINNAIELETMKPLYYQLYKKKTMLPG